MAQSHYHSVAMCRVSDTGKRGHHLVCTVQCTRNYPMCNAR